MNDTLKTISNRRSIRSFKAQPVSDADISSILDCAIMAPNARNMQQWHFSVVRSGKLIEKMVDKIKENIMKSDVEFLKDKARNPGYHTFHKAPVVIVISGDSTNKHIRFDCGAAAENINLAAESLGLGTCIIASSELLFAVEDRDEEKKMLEIPMEYSHIGCIALGYKADGTPVSPKRNKNVISYLD